MDIECKEVANLALSGVKGYNQMNGRIYDQNGACPTIRANSGGHNEIKIMEPAVLRMVRTEKGKAIRKAYESHEVDCGFNENRIAEPRTDGVSNTLSTVQKDNLLVESNIRVRKLTPKECWRLMGFDDESFERAAKAVSDAQLYKQAGNSIVVDVLMAIFKEMIE